MSRFDAVSAAYGNQIIGHPDVHGYAFGFYGEPPKPYLHVCVKRGTGALLEQLIPDRVDGIDVFYQESNPFHLLRGSAA